MKLDTARDRARVVSERLLFGMLVVAAFAAGSMGAFLLFTWPPLIGPLILGYLLAFLLVRLGLTATRFLLAPGGPRMRLVPVSTQVAWFWHRWIARLIGTAAIGWQTILTLHTLGMPQAGIDVLDQLLLLASHPLQPLERAWPCAFASVDSTSPIGHRGGSTGAAASRSCAAPGARLREWQRGAPI